jgi:3-hydroxyacyl-[acyl-carrier-protein] dehydratase
LTKNLYKVLQNNKTEIIIKLTNEQHPIFQAHFPSNPILPGFLQIDIIAEILQDNIIKIKNTKFIAHIFPNDTITYSIKENNNSKSIKITKDNKKISEFKYESK